jgi:hypothetical protein
MQSEAFLASEFTAKLAVARSIPEATTAWQEWACRSMQLNVENASHLLADGQKLMEMGSAPPLQRRFLHGSGGQHLNSGAMRAGKPSDVETIVSAKTRSRSVTT